MKHHRKIDGYGVIQRIGRHNMANLSDRRCLYTGGGNVYSKSIF